MDYADPEVASLRRSSTGIIAAIMMWHHYGDLQVARLRRSWNGSIAPIINMYGWPKFFRLYIEKIYGEK
jgi:hypothetical protein